MYTFEETFCTTLPMKKFVALLSFLLLGFYISLAQCPDYNSKSVAAYRDNHSIAIGKIKIIADYAGSYKVSLFHSDQPTTAFRSWNFKQNEQLILSTPKDGQLNLANDWGIQIEFENGVKRRQALKNGHSTEAI